MAVKERQGRNMPELVGLGKFREEAEGLHYMHHPNIVRLVGYCKEGSERLLVYEYIPMGSLKDVLYGECMKPKLIGWGKRLKIAYGLSKALVYLHDIMKCPHGNLKPSNVLIGENYKALLTDTGLAGMEPKLDHIHKGYNAPEVLSPRDKLTKSSDVYSFGIILLALLSGRKAYDFTRSENERFLVDWARPLIKKQSYEELIDPRLTRRNIRVPNQELLYVVNLAIECVWAYPRVDIMYAANILSFCRKSYH